MALTTYGTQIDLRPLAPREREPLVFNTFRALDPNESVELIHNHDLQPLYEQFRAEWSGRFSWNEVQCQPGAWRVRIVKLAGHGDGRCCGSCGGA
jgi:uncharacterized protein (DUF2249 family)